MDDLPNEVTGHNPTWRTTQRDWYQWHEAYDHPASALSQRLLTVQRHLRQALHQLPSGPIRLVSICAGQARDVTGVSLDHPRAADVVGRLVEQDARNAAVAREALAQIGADGIDVVTSDAAQSEAYRGAVPGSRPA